MDAQSSLSCLGSRPKRWLGAPGSHKPRSWTAASAPCWPLAADRALSLPSLPRADVSRVDDGGIEFSQRSGHAQDRPRATRRLSRVESEEDAYTVTSEVEAYAAEIQAPRELELIEGGGHSSFFFRNQFLRLLTEYAGASTARPPGIRNNDLRTGCSDRR